jgi:two-component sensor histidine kinase
MIEAAEVKIRPNVEITEEMAHRIRAIALDYALGEKYKSMARYTINIGELGRSLGLSYGQFYDELRAALFQLEGSIKFDKNAVTTLLMKE